MGMRPALLALFVFAIRWLIIIVYGKARQLVMTLLLTCLATLESGFVFGGLLATRFR